jgi:CheY-like chemotaxis protein
VESVYGQGTSFHAEIPKVLGDGTLIHTYDSEEIAIYAPEAKILVVDDNMINLNVASGLLRLCSITPQTAASGKEAIKLVGQNQYDLVFMDYRMPEMSGVEATKIIRELGITVPIIALTASAVSGAKEMMLESGMNDFLTKPIIKSELKSILKKWIPAGKLLTPPSDINAGAGEDDEEYRDFWDKIGQIEEISLATGLDRVAGQRDIYKKTLKLMLADIDKSDRNLRKFLAAADMHNFRIEVHGIKGSLANIGAMELAAKAFELESASSKEDSGFCAANLPPFLVGLSKLNQKLQEAFAAIRQSNGPVDIPPALPLILARLTEAFAEIDLVGIDKEIENLSALNLSGALQEKIEHINDAVIMMDYAGATEHITELLNKA